MGGRGGGGTNCRRRHYNRVDYGIWFTELYTYFYILHISDQIKVSKVPLQIGHCHPCTKGYLKLRLHSLFFRQLEVISNLSSNEEISVRLFLQMDMKSLSNIRVIGR